MNVQYKIYELRIQPKFSSSVKFSKNQDVPY